MNAFTLVLAGLATAAATVCELTDTYGNLASVGASIPSTEYCGNSTCEASMASSITDGFLAAIGSAVNPASYPASLVSCMCDSTVSQNSFMSIGGLVNPGNKQGYIDICANTACKNDVLNSDSGPYAGAAVLTCLFAQNCDVPTLKAAITECVCDANTIGDFDASFTYHYGTDMSADGRWQPFCAIPSCSALTDLFVSMGVPGARSCAQAIGGIIGGVVGAIGVPIVATLVVLGIRNRKARAAGSSGPTV